MEERSKLKRWVRFLILITIIISAIYFGFSFLKNIFSSQAIYTSYRDSQLKQTSKSLSEVVQNALSGTKGIYGIYIKNLKTGEIYSSNEHQNFKAGSLYKLWIMATTYKQIQEGKLTKDQILSEDVEILNEKFNIDPDLAELSEGIITLPVSDALNQMITVSHNYAALLLTEKIKLSSVATFLKEAEFNESSVGTTGDLPKTTPFDIALFYEKLYKGELVSREYSLEMINLLKNQKLNEGLPKYLPDKSKIANKTGDLGWFKHDAGIIFTDKGDYIITIMSESDSPSGAQERIAEVSKSVFDYFTNSPN